MQPIVLTNKSPIDQVLDTYTFKGRKGLCRWPRQQGQGLGPCGMWNFLWRLGFHPKQLTCNQLPKSHQDSLLFVDKTTPMDNDTLQRLHNWMQQGGKIIAAGGLDSWKSFFPPEHSWQISTFENPYAASAYLLDDYRPQLIAPPKWTFIEYIGASLLAPRYIGQIAAVQGERQTPHRAHLLCQPKAPAIIQHHSFYYFNGQPFSAFQAWLQGQEDLTPWLSWRHRLFWLDEWVSFFCDLMIRLNIFQTTMERPGIKTLNKTTIILRHDLDYSRDVTFLSEENKRHLGATHAVLKDRNADFWIKQLKQFKNHEIAFHYNTGQRNWSGLIRRLLTKKSCFSFTPNFRQIAGFGLLKQLKWAKQRGINIKTIHRHLCYLIYPEWIDALDTVFDSNLNVLGSSSLFRGHVLKWGINHVEGNHGFLGDWPDSQFPLWYPFKLAHAGKNGKILKGWEMTTLMDIEPQMLIQLLDQKIKHISQNVFTVIYHPAHANQSSLYRYGSFKHFKSILDILAVRNIDVMPMFRVLEEVNKSVEAKQNAVQ